VEGWFSTDDFFPELTCEVELEAGEKINALYSAGRWLNMKGEPITPVRFRPLKTTIIQVIVPGEVI
jgi:hypothetical protein